MEARILPTRARLVGICKELSESPAFKAIEYASARQAAATPGDVVIVVIHEPYDDFVREEPRIAWDASDFAMLAEPYVSGQDGVEFKAEDNRRRTYFVASEETVRARLEAEHRAAITRAAKVPQLGLSEARETPTPRKTRRIDFGDL